jgi:hypothetical protein
MSAFGLEATTEISVVGGSLNGPAQHELLPYRGPGRRDRESA